LPCIESKSLPVIAEKLSAKKDFDDMTLCRVLRDIDQQILPACILRCSDGCRLQTRLLRPAQILLFGFHRESDLVTAGKNQRRRCRRRLPWRSEAAVTRLAGQPCSWQARAGLKVTFGVQTIQFIAIISNRISARIALGKPVQAGLPDLY
jgi:hypothetical protein